MDAGEAGSGQEQRREAGHGKLCDVARWAARTLQPNWTCAWAGDRGRELAGIVRASRSGEHGVGWAWEGSRMLRAPPETVDVGLGLWMASLARQLWKLGPFLAQILAQTQVENNPCLIKGNLLGNPKGRSHLPLFTAWFANSTHRRGEGGGGTLRKGGAGERQRWTSTGGEERAGARTLGDEWDELDGLPSRGLLCQRVPYSLRPGSPCRRGSWGCHRRRARHTGGDGALQHLDRPSLRFCVVSFR